jgi:protein subunit release factor A
VSQNNFGEAIDAYNKKIERRNELLAEGWTEEDNSELAKLNEEIKDAAEAIDGLEKAQENLYEIEKQEALLNENKFNKENNLTQYATSSLKDYEAQRENIIQTLKDEKHWTDAQI